MLPEEVRQQIRESYFRLLEKSSLSPRWGQRQMVAEVARALGRVGAPEEGAPVCVIEAGTGTGKTIAYAVAAIPAARHLEKKLVVATATVALQEQLCNKDLPDIRKHSGLEFDFALAKGRRRYVCLSRLDKLLASPSEQVAQPLFPDELSPPVAADALPVYTRMREALGRGEWDGDRDNWRRELSEPVWFSVTADRSECSGRKCPHFSQCCFFRARDALYRAEVIVANHDLVFSDLALGGGAILPEPENCIYVFDEGHHLPERVLNHFSAFCSLGSSRQWLEDSRKQLATAAAQLRAVERVAEAIGKLAPQFEPIGDSLQGVEMALRELVQQQEPPGGERQHYRLPNGHVPAALQQPSQALSERFEYFEQCLSRIVDTLEQLLEDDLPGIDEADAEAWYAAFGAMLGRAQGQLALWRQYAVSGEDEEPPSVRWIGLVESGGKPGFELRASPMLATGVLRECLWERAAAVVVTSATLAALKSFERFRFRSGAPRDAIYKVVASPFDYRQAVLSVPAMAAEPRDPRAHTEALIALLPELLSEGEGSLVLFASRRQMRDVFEGLAEAWRERVLVQGDYSKREMLRRHRGAVDQGETSVIFGLASFAEGVDLPGRYCNHVVIAKIPFAVPDSPMESALSEWLKSQGRDPFMEVAVPDAALRLVQASGRLLRTERDTGRVSLLDRRLVTKRYGRAILDSLPPFRREIA